MYLNKKELNTRDQPSKRGRPQGSKAKTNWICSSGHIHKVGETCDETGESSQYLLTRVRGPRTIRRGRNAPKE